MAAPKAAKKKSAPAKIALPVYDRKGNAVETIDIDPSLFGGIVRRALLKQVVIGYEANLRQGTHDTKGRSEISYSNKKPWAQKHTGNARAGKRSSPLWRHGGTIFGPTPRSYRQTLTAGMRRAALDSAILAKMVDNEVKLLTDLQMDKPRTKDAASVLKNLKIERGCLVGTADYDDAVWKSFRNIPRVSVEPVGRWNALSVLRHRNLVMPKAALARLLESKKKREGAAHA